ncbi:uncharacterized protein PITG_16345 [Phytophthora infestans T30-4]|uniref:Uncharacterized protein n=1 Tax=Phytophthora infestans (strain T30-4) TaxID=403677 RepID=D0NU26_PHYIT|nr:uncharacterized protein PITG_16345 [Phytophthora infestans T30-4]EEY65150.1 conserved hypothetical protein [Phytophthora infestans T30-4]|eukprot:XP_002897407.1 conserved hypothetical protein [Phytophthora infestans T30-4]
MSSLNTKSGSITASRRQAPPLLAIMKTSIRSSFPDEVPEYTEEWRRMWRITSSICSTNLWMQRNRTIFQQEETTDEVSVKAFWSTAIRQLTAIARREQRKPETQEKGTRLRICQAALASRPREHPPRVKVEKAPDPVFREHFNKIIEQDNTGSCAETIRKLFIQRDYGTTWYYES